MKKTPPQTIHGEDGVRLSGILSSSAPVSGKRNTRNGQHRFQTELQESGDSADNQNTGTLASRSLKEGLCVDSGDGRTVEHHRGDSANDARAKQQSHVTHTALYIHLFILSDLFLHSRLFCRCQFVPRTSNTSHILKTAAGLTIVSAEWSN